MARLTLAIITCSCSSATQLPGSVLLTGMGTNLWIPFRSILKEARERICHADQNKSTWHILAHASSLPEIVKLGYFQNTVSFLASVPGSMRQNCIPKNSPHILSAQCFMWLGLILTNPIQDMLRCRESQDLIPRQQSWGSKPSQLYKVLFTDTALSNAVILELSIFSELKYKLYKGKKSKWEKARYP